MAFAQVVDLSSSADLLRLDQTLGLIPRSATIRGLFFHSLASEVQRRRLYGIPRLDGLLAVRRRSYILYPVADLVEAAALAAPLVDANPHEGLRQLFTPIAEYATGTWYGKIFARYLTPHDALRWLERSREYIANYGRWRLEHRGPGHAIMHKYDEYFWFDGLQGACEGMLKLCGVKGDVQIEMDGPFRGRLVIRWDE